MSVAAARTNPLSFLTDQLDELKAKGTHFKLRVLEDEQAAVCTFDGKSHQSRFEQLSWADDASKLREAALEATRKLGVGSGACAPSPAPCAFTWSWKRRLRASRR